MKTMMFFKRPIYFDHDINELVASFKDKKKIIVFCSGPSATKAKIHSDNLYLATNDGYKGKLEKVDFLLFLNDQFAINRILVKNSHFKKDQKFLYYYHNTKSHRTGFEYLIRKLFLLRRGENCFLLENSDFPVANRNFTSFNDFYAHRNLPVKIQNSGMFLLLFGYYMATILQLPLEIYGLDLGVGGVIHHNSSFKVGKSVLRERVKENVKMYLNHMYQHYPDLKNYSNFYGKT